MEANQKAIVYCIKQEPFKGIAELDELIETLDERKLSTVAPYMPKGGEVYVYTWDTDNEETKSSWRCDHHRWRQYGGRGYPFSKSKYFKEFSSIILEDGTWSNAFQRITFTPLDPNLSLIVIHYVGDHTLSKVPYRYMPRIREPRRAPFDNLRKERKTPKKIRMTPLQSGSSVKQKKSTKMKKMDSTKFHYEQSLQALSDTAKSKVLGWLNLKGLALHLDGFIHRLTIIPVTICICGSLTIREEFSKVLDLQSSQPQILWFGGTIKLDDFFITPLMFRHLLLEGSPLMPLLFAIHDERFENCASEILLYAVNHIPQLTNVEIPIMTERNVQKIVRSFLPNARIIHTWGHIGDEVRRWAKLNGYRDSSQFCSHLSELLDCKSPEEYNSLFENYKDSLPRNWVQFFTKELTPDIKQSSARWVLEELGLFSSFTDITKQVCEDYETVIQGFKSMDCITVDMLVLAFHYLHSYLLRQARMAQCGLPSTFSIKPEFQEILNEETEITVPENVIYPANIVEAIQQQFSSTRVDNSSQCVSREYVIEKMEPENMSETTVEESQEDIVFIQAVDDSTENVIETIEVTAADIQQLAQQPVLQRSLINGKLFHTYPRTGENNL